MKIFAIVVFPNEGQSYSVSINPQDKNEPREVFIKEHYKSLDYLNHEPTYNKSLDSFFYAGRTSKNSFAFAVDEELDKSSRVVLYYKIATANEVKDLVNLIHDPEEITKLKRLLQSAEELKLLAIDNVDKIIKIVVDYLEKTKESLKKPAAILTLKALREAYPCKRDDTTKKEEKKQN